MSIKTQSQERAKFVLEHINKLKGSPYAEKLSSYILTNGLLPTLAFLKGKDEAKNVYDVFNEYLKSKISYGDELIKYLAENNTSILRIATKEALELANWIKRLAKSENNNLDGKKHA